MEHKHSNVDIEKLQQLLEEVNNDESEQKQIEKEDMIEIDVLNLPPRSEVHLSTKKRLKLSFSSPFGRFLLFIIFIILICTGVYFYFGEEILTFFMN